MSYTIPNDVVGGTAEQHTQATPDSVDFTLLTSAIGGTGVVNSGCAVTAQGSPNMTVAVSSGVVGVWNRQVNDNVTGANATIGTADGTNPRFDIVTIAVAGTITVVAGTPAQSPVFPTIPGTSVALAAVYVAAGASAITSADIIDKRLFLPQRGDGTTPLGRVAGATGTGSTTLSTTLSTETTILTASSYTYVSGRRYKFTANTRIQAGLATQTFSARVKDGATTLAACDALLSSTGGAGAMTFVVIGESSALSGSKTLTFVATQTAGTATTAGTAAIGSSPAHVFIIEDIGV